MKNRLCAVCAIALGVLASGCSSFSLADLLGKMDRPRIEAVRPRVTGINFKGVQLAFDVDVANPYSFAIKAPAFDYGLRIKESDFARSSENVKVTLPARKTGTMTLPVRVGYMDLWKAYQGMKGAKEVPYTFQGTLSVPVMGKTIKVPVEKSGAFPVMRMPKMSVKEVGKPQISLGGASMGIKADFLNTNAFSLGLDGLGYVLKLGDVEFGGFRATTSKTVGAGQSAPLELKAEFSGLQAIRQLMQGASLGKASLAPTGSLKTPYGKVKIPKK